MLNNKVKINRVLIKNNIGENMARIFTYVHKKEVFTWDYRTCKFYFKSPHLIRRVIVDISNGELQEIIRRMTDFLKVSDYMMENQQKYYADKKKWESEHNA